MAGWLLTASVPLPTWTSQEAASSGDATAKNTGSTTCSEKGAPGWEGEYHAWALSVHPIVTQAGHWSFTLPPKERSSTDLVWLGLAWCPFHKTSHMVGQGGGWQEDGSITLH